MNETIQKKQLKEQDARKHIFRIDPFTYRRLEKAAAGKGMSPEQFAHDIIMKQAKRELKRLAAKGEQ